MRIIITAVLLLLSVQAAAAAVHEIPTLDMSTASQLGDGVTDPWYAALIGLTGLLILMIIFEIAKKMGWKTKGKLW